MVSDCSHVGGGNWSCKFLLLVLVPEEIFGNGFGTPAGLRHWGPPCRSTRSVTAAPLPAVCHPIALLASWLEGHAGLPSDGCLKDVGIGILLGQP